MSGPEHSRQSSSARNNRQSTQSTGSPYSSAVAAPIDSAGSPPQSAQQRAILSSPHSSPPSRLHNHPSIPRRLLAPLHHRPHVRGFSFPSPHSRHHNSMSSSSSLLTASHLQGGPSVATMPSSPPLSRRVNERARSRSRDAASLGSPPTSPIPQSLTSSGASPQLSTPRSKRDRKKSADALAAIKARAKSAQIENDAMVYLDGPQVYTCAQCRTHLTSHDDIISKSFHGRHGRAYLFDQCVNVTIGPAEDRILITGLHSVCDIFCKRCKGMVGWTYAKAYESSQKYKEGKFIIEKINLHLEESDYYDVSHPAGERADKWRIRSMSWGSERSITSSPGSSKDMVYEYKPSSPFTSPRQRARSTSTGSSSIGSPSVGPKDGKMPSKLPGPPLL
mmetsp:Transcript_14085/g.19277  ORF Transcript_14085/g.19277 Transcript_14085/m.19277 type:complete len:391 (-) Transcript_14085:249-1421(-)